jgi:hypothetical protein
MRSRYIRERITHSRDCIRFGAPSGVKSLGTSSNARKVSARLGRDLASPRYFVCPCAHVTRPNDAFHYNGREKRGLQIRPHSLVIGLSFERTNPGTSESLINDHGLTVSLVDVKQKSKRFGDILVCAHDEPEGGFAWSAVGRPKHVSVPNTGASSFIAKVKTHLRLARRLCDCRWNRWAWEVVGFE